MINIAWCITGGGAGLRSVVKYMNSVREKDNYNITVFLTKWGFEVARIFGVLEDLRRIADNSYYREFLVEDEGMFYIGRLNLRKYHMLIIAPATANSVAKMVLGIADNIASALYAQSIKSGVPVIVMPTDLPGEDGFVESEIPCYIDKSLCSIEICGTCPLVYVCPTNAITSVGKSMRIDLSKCIGCERCVSVCLNRAVKCWEKVKLKPRTIDIENITKLSQNHLTMIVRNIEELNNILKNMVKNLESSTHIT